MEFNIGERVVVNTGDIEHASWITGGDGWYDYLGTIIGYSADGKTSDSYLIELEGVPRYHSGKNDGIRLTRGHYGEHAAWCRATDIRRPDPVTMQINETPHLNFDVGDIVLYADSKTNYSLDSVYTGTICGIIDEPEKTAACYLVDLNGFNKSYTGKDFALSDGTYGTHAVWASDNELKKIK